jgi:hypothetical protein
MDDRINKLETAKTQQLKQAEERLNRNIAAMKSRHAVEEEQIKRRFDSEIHAAKMAMSSKPDKEKLN